MFKTILLGIFVTITVFFIIGSLIGVFWFGVAALSLLCKLAIPFILLMIIMFVLGVLFGEL